MATLNLSDDDLNFIANALPVAAERYEQNAEILSPLPAASPELGQALTRLSNHFSYQADKARALAAQLED